MKYPIAQAMFGLLIAVLIICGTVLISLDHFGSGWTLLGFGCFGFLMLIAMLINDRTPTTPGT